MASDNAQDRRKPRSRDTVVSVISVGTLVSVLGGIWKIDDYLNKIVESRVSILKPNGDYIRGICKELLIEERERTKEREAQLKESIDFLMRYYRRG